MKQSTKCLVLGVILWVFFFLNIFAFNFGWLSNIHPIMFVYFGFFTLLGGFFSTLGWFTYEDR